eukprot:6557584-Prymnesium_polylepis.1
MRGGGDAAQRPPPRATGDADCVWASLSHTSCSRGKKDAAPGASDAARSAAISASRFSCDATGRVRMRGGRDARAAWSGRGFRSERDRPPKAKGPAHVSLGGSAVPRGRLGG